METIVRNVSEIQEDQKRWLEDALGRELQGNQRVLIMVLNPGAMADADIRRQALADLKQLSAKGGENAQRQGIAEQEADEALNEAMDHVRPRSGD
jgi:hypothetical protein